MPELPEVETVRQGLLPHVKKRVIKKVTLNRDSLRAPLPKDLKKKMEGKTIDTIDRHGKTLLWRLKGGPDLAWHLGMSGSFRVSTDDKPEHGKHDHIIMDMDDGTEIAFNDPRRFGSLGYAKDLPGIDPMTKDFSAAAFTAMLENRKGPIKVLLMDQRLISGIGNIYASEALWSSKINPERPAGEVTKAEAKKLHAAIIDVLTLAIASGGSSLRNHMNVDGKLGYFQHHFKVYGRTGKPCPRCKTTIKLLRQAGRATFFCPQCQAK